MTKQIRNDFDKVVEKLNLSKENISLRKKNLEDEWMAMQDQIKSPSI